MDELERRAQARCTGRSAERRFPPPWRCAETPGGFVVRDANGQALAYFYGHPTREAADIAKGLTLDEARRLAVNFAKLPELHGARK